MDNQIAFYRAKLEYETDSWDLFLSMENSQDVVVIDARSEEAYAREHIPGSLNLPHREMSESTTSGLSKSILYVTYCDGIGCNASTKGALKMAHLGFRVKELIGGLDWWKRDGYGTEGTLGRAGKSLSCGC